MEDKSMFDTIHHIAIIGSDYEKSKHFYVDLLGFEIDAGICKSKVTLYSHEEEALQGMQMDFYEALLKYGLKCDE